MRIDTSQIPFFATPTTNFKRHLTGDLPVADVAICAEMKENRWWEGGGGGGRHEHWRECARRVGSRVGDVDATPEHNRVARRTLHLVLAALHADFTGRADIGFGAKLLEVGKGVDLGRDEVLLEVAVDDSGCLGRGRVALDAPGSHLLVAGREVVHEAQRRVARLDDARQRRLGANGLAVLRRLLVAHADELRALWGEGDGGQRGMSVFLVGSGSRDGDNPASLDLEYTLPARAHTEPL